MGVVEWLAKKNLKKATENYLWAVDSCQSETVVSDRRTRYLRAVGMLAAETPSAESVRSVIVETVARRAKTPGSVQAIANDMSDEHRGAFLSALSSRVA